MPAEPVPAWKGPIRAYLPNLVYGANDGLITTFAIVSGVVGASLSTHIVLILGFASLFADGVSMGASNYLSERTPREDGRMTSRGQAARYGVATFAGFLFFGFVPLLAYLLPLGEEQRFTVAALMTLAALFAVGAGRAVFARLPWVRAGFEMLVVGAAAAALAFGVGQLGALIVGPDGAGPF